MAGGAAGAEAVQKRLRSPGPERNGAKRSGAEVRASGAFFGPAEWSGEEPDPAPDRRSLDPTPETLAKLRRGRHNRSGYDGASHNSPDNEIPWILQIWSVFRLGSQSVLWDRNGFAGILDRKTMVLRKILHSIVPVDLQKIEFLILKFQS